MTGQESRVRTIRILAMILYLFFVFCCILAILRVLCGFSIICMTHCRVRISHFHFPSSFLHYVRCLTNELNINRASYVNQHRQYLEYLRSSNKRALEALVEILQAPMGRSNLGWQVALLLSNLSYFQSFITPQQKLPRNLSRKNGAPAFLNMLSTNVLYERAGEMSNLEEIELFLYNDAIDNKLTQGEFYPSNDLNRGIASSRNVITDSSQLDYKILQMMLRVENENAVRSVSLFGGLLSVLISRDIWYAASSFLVVNTIATQSNGFGTVARVIGARIDLVVRKIRKIVKLFTEFCFKGDIDGSAFKDRGSRGSKGISSAAFKAASAVYVPKNSPIPLKNDYLYRAKDDVEESAAVSTKKTKTIPEKRYYYDFSIHDAATRKLQALDKKGSATLTQSNTLPESSVIPVIKEVLNIVAPPIATQYSFADTNPNESSNNGSASGRIPLGTLISSAAKSAVKMKPPVAQNIPSPSAVYAATASLPGKDSRVATAKGVSQAVRNCRIEPETCHLHIPSHPLHPRTTLCDVMQCDVMRCDAI